jgi:hypothetical protein
LRGEGIVILGQYRSHQEVAKALGLPIPGRGESVSVRLAPKGGHHGDMQPAELEGQEWDVAQDGDPRTEEPKLPER